MTQKTIEQMLWENGYQYCKVKPDETNVFYKYENQEFHIVVTVDTTKGYSMLPQQQRIMEERIKSIFFHADKNLNDFPEGLPIYDVDVLTLLIGIEDDTMRMVCAQCQNVWIYQIAQNRLLIYENQPGDFWGLKELIEKGSQTETFETKVKKLPFVTIAIIIVNVVTFLILEILGDTENGLFIASHGGMHPNFILYSGQWWRIITAGFLHFGIEHLVNNMLIFACVGVRLERAIGHWKILFVYMLSEIGGGLLSYFMMLQTNDYAISAGASGAVFGIIGGMLWAVIWNKGKLEGLTTKGIAFMILLSLYFGFTAGGVDNWAHIGGMLTGFVATALIYHGKSQKC